MRNLNQVNQSLSPDLALAREFELARQEAELKNRATAKDAHIATEQAVKVQEFLKADDNVMWKLVEVMGNSQDPAALQEHERGEPAVTRSVHGAKPREVFTYSNRGQPSS